MTGTFILRISIKMSDLHACETFKVGKQLLCLVIIYFNKQYLLIFVNMSDYLHRFYQNCEGLETLPKIEKYL